MPSNDVHSEEQSLSYKLALKWIKENNLAGLVDLIQGNLTLDESMQLVSTHTAEATKLVEFERDMYVQQWNNLMHWFVHHVGHDTIEEAKRWHERKMADYRKRIRLLINLRLKALQTYKFTEDSADKMFMVDDITKALGLDDE